MKRTSSANAIIGMISNLATIDLPPIDDIGTELKSVDSAADKRDLGISAGSDA